MKGGLGLVSGETAEPSIGPVNQDASANPWTPATLVTAKPKRPHSSVVCLPKPERPPPVRRAYGRSASPASRGAPAPPRRYLQVEGKAGSGGGSGSGCGDGFDLGAAPALNSKQKAQTSPKALLEQPLEMLLETGVAPEWKAAAGNLFELLGVSRDFQERAESRHGSNGDAGGFR